MTFAELLTGAQPAEILPLERPTDTYAALGRADLLIVAAEIADGALPPSVHTAFELAGTRPGRIAGPFAFALTIGAWPAPCAANLLLKPLLQAAGAVCLAPGLHVSAAQSARPQLAIFSRYWRPVVSALAARTTALRTLGA
ncbi:hypothetical protein [Mycobacterium sp. MAA66]|uniref:hypothetical protein n=1 Tax=Mycobacterium sp. MAA66 TaxID=3156297 RepID=UPI00351751B8